MSAAAALERLPICKHCREPIEPGQRNISGRHYECACALVNGGLYHQRRLCSCFVAEGYRSPDPPSLTPREAARVAATYFHRSQGRRCVPILD